MIWIIVVNVLVVVLFYNLLRIKYPKKTGAEAVREEMRKVNEAASMTWPIFAIGLAFAVIMIALSSLGVI